MKIGMVCYPTFGGSGVVATELGLELARRGHEIHFVSHDPPARYRCNVERVMYHHVGISSYPLFKYPPYLLAMASKLADVTENEGLDLIHVHYAIPHTFSAGLARSITGRTNLPIVTTLHGTDVTIVGKEPEYFRVVKYALASSDGVTAVSQSLAAETRSTFGFDGDIEVIPNFVDTEVNKPEAGDCIENDGPRPDCSDKVLIHVSNFRPVKNAPDVVRVFAKVAQKLPARLMLVGDGPELADCRRLAKELGVADRVRALGETPDIPRAMACADLFVLPSEHESFGLAALEAMACGVPVIATRAGGIPEVVTDGQTGLLYKTHDVDGMAAGALELLSDESKLKAMSAAARERAGSQFAAPKIVPLYEEFYRRTLERAQAESR